MLTINRDQIHDGIVPLELPPGGDIDEVLELVERCHLCDSPLLTVFFDDGFGHLRHRSEYLAGIWIERENRKGQRIKELDSVGVLQVRKQVIRHSPKVYVALK